jgi:hypothetical protein
MNISTLGFIVIAALVVLRLVLLFISKRGGSKFLAMSIIESFIKSLGKMV